MSVFHSSFLALTSIPRLGCRGALRAFLSTYCGKTFAIRPVGYQHPISVRGRTSDRIVLRSIFVEEQYALAAGPVSRILDAGANVGYSAIYFARHCSQAEIVAVEPEAENYAMLKKNTAPYANIHAVQGAVWKDAGGVRISNPTSAPWSFQVESRLNNSGALVPSFRIEDLMKKFDWADIDLLKMDVEGAEREIFASGAPWLARTKTLIIEVHDAKSPGAAKAVFGALQAYSYSLAVQGDCLCIHLDHGE